jgi:conjugative relaxase-like TrwC/TraI family protein
MLTISKPLGASQAKTYHKEEFQNAQENYYTEGERVRGEWHGKLAERWGLRGEVAEEHFGRLADGQHPLTGEQLVRHQVSREYQSAWGKTVTTMEHRAGWDATLSAPKSVSLTALVGGDERVTVAHRESVDIALNELERYVQARIGSNYPAVTTAAWVAAKFEHDSSRPVDGYAAPQLHTHVVAFNLTELPGGETRALQPKELYRAQKYVTAVYRSELALRVKALGYEVERGKSGQPEIKGYTREYLEASSPRSREIREHLEEAGLHGAGPAQIAAHQTRGSKLELSHKEMQGRHRDMAVLYGNQPERVVGEARGRQVEEIQEGAKQRAIDSALTYARERNLERSAVTDERDLLRDALTRSMGDARLEEVRAKLESRVARGELIEAKAPIGRAYTTDQMVGLERDNIERMRAGQGRYDELASETTRRAVLEANGHLNAGQRTAADEVLKNRDQVVALEGVAGSGKTTSLAAIREGAEREGFAVQGFAPTSRAAHKLEEAGVHATTLQRHLARGEEKRAGRHFYIVDESSLTSTKQMNDFLSRLHEQDRVLLVGDVRQHQAVDAGRPYEQLQEAGMQTARLTEIVRQKDPELRAVVEQLSRGQVREALDALDRQGRIHEIPGREERLKAIAEAYAKQPEGTLVFSPDNKSRQKINGLVHRELQQLGRVETAEHKVRVLEARPELTGADRAWAGQYEKGDVVRYSKGSKQLGLGKGEYARVARVDAKENRITVERASGERVTYDPRRLQGVAVYQEAERNIACGDRVQFTAPSKELGVTNRQLGQVEWIEPSGDVRLRMDSGREVAFNMRQHPHLDYGYAMTSHSGQGQTSSRQLVHVETEKGQQLVNSRTAYVSISRGQDDARIFTNDKTGLFRELSREVSHATALDGVAQKAVAAAVEGPAVAAAVVPAVAKAAVGAALQKVKEVTIDLVRGEHNQCRGV